VGSIESLVAIVGGLLGIIAVGAAAIAVVRSSLVQTRLKIADGMIIALRGDRDDLQTRLTRVEEECKETATQLRVTQSDLKAEKDKVTYLEGLVAGREDFKALKEAAEEHNTKSAERSAEILKHLETNKKIMSRIAEKVGA